MEKEKNNSVGVGSARKIGSASILAALPIRDIFETRNTQYRLNRTRLQHLEGKIHNIIGLIE